MTEINKFEKISEITKTDEHNIENILAERKILTEVLEIISDSLDIQKALEELSKTTDKYTLDHILRTANDACRVAKFRKLSEDEMNLLIRAALLHDVGKIDEEIAPLIISSKEFGKNSKERKKIKNHVRESKKYCEEINLLEESKIVIAHHEKTDRYPRDHTGANERRSGDIEFYESDKRNGDRREKNRDLNIERLIDLFNIIDQYDALLNERSYKKYLTGQELRKKIDWLKEIFPQEIDVIEFLTKE